MPFIPDEESQESIGRKAAGFVFKALNIPSEIVGGSLKATREALKGEFVPPKTGVNLPGTELDIGSLLLPTLVGAVRGPVEETPIMEEFPKSIGIQPESVAGVLTGLGAEIATPDPLDFIKFGSAASKVTTKFGKTITEAGEKFALKALKPTKSQLTKFTRATGEQLQKIISKEGLSGQVLENTLERMRKLQDDFDDIAINSGLRISIDDLIVKIDDKTEELRSGFNKAVKGRNKIASDLNKWKDELRDIAFGKTDEAGEVIVGLADEAGKVDVGDLTALRKAIDGEIPDAQWLKYLQGDANTLTTQRGIIQDLIREVSEESGVVSPVGKSLREVGQELNILIEVKKIAEVQQNLGKGSKVIGLTDILAASAGTLSAEDTQGKVTNALIMVGLNRFASNPKVVGAISNVMIEGGEKLLQSEDFPKVIELILRATKEDIITGLRPASDLPESGFSPN